MGSQDLRYHDAMESRSQKPGKVRLGKSVGLPTGQRGRHTGRFRQLKRDSQRTYPQKKATLCPKSGTTGPLRRLLVSKRGLSKWRGAFGSHAMSGASSVPGHGSWDGSSPASLWLWEGQSGEGRAAPLTRGRGTSSLMGE